MKWICLIFPLFLGLHSLLSAQNMLINQLENTPSYHSDGFDFPVGKPDAKAYYNAQAFGRRLHLGDDWNAKTGGNTDLGHPIYSVANGIVVEAKDYKGGWGNVIRVLHRLPDGTPLESLYAHCNEILVQKGDWIKRGQQIGTIGTAHGKYLAHLHLEMRSTIGMPLGGGYSKNTMGYINPSAYIRKNRP